MMEDSSQKKEMLSEFLHCAARGDTEEMSTSPMRRPDLINIQHAESGDTALIVAVRENQPEVIAFLLDHGADVTLHNFSSQTALHVANDEIRAQLLSAVRRTSFPQLSLAQAAWQGDLETVRHLLSTDFYQDVNALNAQGLTPLMLAVCDVDLLEALTMEREYRPESVLEELIQCHGDPRLLDLSGNSAMDYASKVKSPIRQQLMDALEKSPPPTETQGGDICGFCADTKPPLYDGAVTSLDRADRQNTHSVNEPAGDAVSVGDTRQELEDEAEVLISPETEGAAGPCHSDLEKNTMDERKKNSLSSQWLPEFSPQHLTSRPSLQKQPALPPLHMKTDKKEVQQERPGLCYLFPGSHSDPNLLEAQLAVDPLRNLRYIKEHIRQRLNLGEATGINKTFPPVSYSPQSPKSYRLRPLPKSSSRNSKPEGSITVSNSETLDKSRDNRLTCGHGCAQKPVEVLDMAISKEQVQISLASVTSSESATSMGDLSSRSAHSSTGYGSGRREWKEGSTSNMNTNLPHICGRILELHTHDKVPRRSRREETHSSLEKDPLAMQKNNETGKNALSDSKDYKLVTSCDKDLLKHETNLLLGNMTHESSKEDNVIKPLHDTGLLDASKVIEFVKINSPRTPRASYMPFVQITFSEQEAKIEVPHPPAKQFHAKRKPNLSILTQVSRSFNINAQKENKSKKTKIRNNSAPNIKYPRPLSNSNGNRGKCVALPALVYSSGPLSSKMSKKAGSKPGSAERNSQRSQTQLSLYTKKRINSPVNPAMPLRANTAHDFQDIHYSDMFVEIKPQNNGPGIFQMFETPVYINSSKENTRGRKETSSASSTRSCASKSIRSGSSRESSARSSKRAKPRSKKNSSAKNCQRKNSMTKSVAAEEISGERRENMVIISGIDWEIKTIKQEQSVSDSTTDNLPCSTPNILHPDFSDLSIIKEATIENSLSAHEAAQITFIKRFQEVELANHTETLKKEYDSVTSERKGKENVEEQSGQISEKGELGQSSTERPSEEVQHSKREATLITLTPREINEEILTDNSEKDATHQACSISIPMKSINGSETSDMLISLARVLKQMDDQSNHSEMVENHQDKDQSANMYQKQHSDEPGGEKNSIEVSRCVSPNGNINNSFQSGKYFEPNDDNSSIHWIKGEVLGRGAYGTVYRGLTSQGELIAAKQVMLHSSDPAVAEKEYKKLQEEVDLLKTLKHENIVGFLGTCLQDNIVTIFMEFVPGGSIASILRHFGPLQEAVISKYTNHILQGIAYLHKNRVVHRDIKGNNVMLMPNGVIKLIDFGCAKRINGLNMNGTRGAMLKSMHGTPYWMAPEVISESGHGEKSDIWSIGCTVFEMATGKPPLAHMNKMAAMYYIATQKGLMPTLPDHFSKKARDFVNLCLIREQEERPSAEQLLQHPFTREKNSIQKSFQAPEEL